MAKKLEWHYDAAVDQHVASPFPGVRYVVRGDSWKLDNNETVNYVKEGENAIEACQDDWDKFIDNQVDVDVEVSVEPVQRQPGFYSKNFYIVFPTTI